MKVPSKEPKALSRDSLDRLNAVNDSLKKNILRLTA